MTTGSGMPGAWSCEIMWRIMISSAAEASAYSSECFIRSVSPGGPGFAAMR